MKLHQKFSRLCICTLTSLYVSEVALTDMLSSNCPRSYKMTHFLIKKKKSINQITESTHAQIPIHLKICLLLTEL